MTSTKKHEFYSQKKKLIFVEKTNKNFVTLSAVMVVAVVFILVLSHSIPFSGVSSEFSDFELKHVHLIFRHGDRTPVSPTYPNDPHINETYAPYGHGQLTKAGYTRSYINGRFFRKHYGSFLGPLYNSTEVYAQSTEYSRTKISLQFMAAGLFPSLKKDFDWDLHLNWHPSDFIVQTPDNNSLLFPLHLNCSRFARDFPINYAPVLAKNKALFESLSGFTGKPIVGLFDVIKLFYDLKTQVDCGFKLPSWADEYYPEKLQALSNEAWGYYIHSDILKRIYGGPLLKTMIADWDAKVTKSSPKKFVLYSGHDATIVGVLGAFNVWNSNDSPDYGIAAIFELRQNRKTGEYGVQAYVRNQPNDEPMLLTIPGCTAFCPLTELKFLLKNHLPLATDCD